MKIYLTAFDGMLKSKILTVPDHYQDYRIITNNWRSAFGIQKTQSDSIWITNKEYVFVKEPKYILRKRKGVPYPVFEFALRETQ